MSESQSLNLKESNPGEQPKYEHHLDLAWVRSKLCLLNHWYLKAVYYHA